MTDRPRLQDVADAVGLAPATVSYALRGERGSPETIERVQRVAAELGYQVNPIARALASGRSGTVAILCGSTRDPWQQRLSTDLARALMACGRHALLADADGDPEREESLLHLLRSQRPDGLLVAPLDPFAPWWENLAQALPVVAIGDRLSKAPSAGAVLFDNDVGMTLVFDHLAALGHSRVAVALPQRPSTPDRPAEELARRHARDRGMTPTLIRVPPATADPDAMVANLRAILEADEQPTALFGLSDSFALNAMRAARHLGLRVPEDLSVVGFEDVEFADLAGPGLTTVSWGHGAAEEAAVTHLLAAVADDSEPQVTMVQPALEVRGTTAPVSGGRG